MKIIKGSVTAAKGFKAAGMHCGIKVNQPEKKDLALIASECLCTAAATFTTNKTKAAPLYVSMDHLADGKAMGIICNSGNANACAPKGAENAIRMCEAAAAATGIKTENFLVASTGVIGYTLDIEAIEKSLPQLAGQLSQRGENDAAEAIMTTDLCDKQAAVEIELAGKTVRIGGIAKGSGMIHPNMGTMLCFITTDCAITSELLQKALLNCVKRTFNRVSVDGDTSTNDTCFVLANGMAGNPMITTIDENFTIFEEALYWICETLAKKIAQDGEGATKLISCVVKNSKDEETAETAAMAIIKSPLVKTAMFGADANWGRVLCAMGYSGAECLPEETSISFRSNVGTITVCQDGQGIDFDEDAAKEILSQSEVEIIVDMAQGNSQVVAWGCDLTYDYVKINGDYRS